MKLRRYFLPHTITDVGSTFFLAIIAPTIFYFELFEVLPSVYAPGTWQFYVNAGVGTFCLFNIVTNQLAMMLTDTSIQGVHLIPPHNNTLHMKLWRLCDVCETLTPPRSWHCNVCNVCVLKRDHHCAFTGNCVGHKNQRYFMMLVFYLFVGTTYANLFNNYFVWVVNAQRFWHLSTIFKIMFPFVVIVVDPSWEQLHLTFYLICMLGMLFTGFLFVYHCQNLQTGSLVHEHKNKALYDLGWTENIRMIFGARWYLVWLNPFVRSELPHDGVHWESVLERSIKHD